MSYRGLYLLRGEGHELARCCRLLGLSSSGFYDWTKSLYKKSSKRDPLEDKIISIFKEPKGTYGSPRILKTLKNEGEKVGKDRVAKIMRENDLKARKKKGFKPKTTVNNPSDRKSARVFRIEDYRVEGENQVWASDLTYIPTRTGFCYLVVVMDLYNREIKGWDLSDTMEAENTKRALTEAIRKSSGDLSNTVFHSDQGVQYCSKVVRDRLALLRMTQSMSRKGNCYDNAFVESFFSTMKAELEKSVFDDFVEAKKTIFEYIEGWYNRKRMHSSLGYLSPMDYKLQNGYVA